MGGGDRREPPPFLYSRRRREQSRRAAGGGEVGPSERERDTLGGGGSCWRRWPCSAADGAERPTRPIEAPRSVLAPSQYQALPAPQKPPSGPYKRPSGGGSKKEGERLGRSPVCFVLVPYYSLCSCVPCDIVQRIVFYKSILCHISIDIHVMFAHSKGRMSQYL